MNFSIASDIDPLISANFDLWEDLRGARVFVTGGTGFFGRWFLEFLLRLNCRMNLGVQTVLLTRDPTAFRQRCPHLALDPAFSFQKGDIRSFDFPVGPFTHVIHGATDASVDLNRGQSLLMLDVIVQGTRRTLDFAAHVGVRKFLFISSGAVYGCQPATLTHLPEDFSGAPDTTHPLSAYGEGKRVAEFLCAAYSRQGLVPAVIARCFAFVGPYLPLDGHFAIGNFIRDAVDGREIHVNGNGTPYRSYLYGSDLALWLWTILIKGGRGRPYNVGSEKRITIVDLAREVANVLHPAIPIRIDREPDPGKPLEQYVPSTRRAREELGLRETVTLRNAIERGAHWYVSSRTKIK
jgi:nucleoside-diphosphate-sugar epimerase